MNKKTINFVYLSEEAKSDQWSYLHRLFHPGTLENDNKAMIICNDLDLSHFAFVTLRAKNFDEKGMKTIHLKYGLVDAILEVVPHKNQFGFVGSLVDHEQQ